MANLMLQDGQPRVGKVRCVRMSRTSIPRYRDLVSVDADPTHEEMVLFDGEVRLHATEDYVRVWHARPPRSVGELAELTTACEHALAHADTGHLLLDTRDSEYPRGELQQRFWEWLDQNHHVSRVAFLVRSQAYADFVNESGIGPGVRARAFQNEDAALEWLRGG